MKILIIKKSDLRKGDKWIHAIKDRNILSAASLVILLNEDGTYQPVKNIYGSNEMSGKFNELLDLSQQ